ncbi:MAG: ParB N-terminal domain-containing protein [bacterium]
MNKNFEDIAIDRIAWSDTRYKLTFRRAPESLIVSVREMGVLNPLIVAESSDPDRFTIVTGWLRFAAAREGGAETVPCHAYRNFAPKILLLCSLFDNLGHRAMNPIEQALALGSLSDHYSRAEIISNFLPLLGCQPHAENWEKIMRLAGLCEELKWAVADGALSPQAARILAGLPKEAGEQAWRLMRSVSMTASLQNETAELFNDLWKRDGLAPSAIISGEDWARFADDPPANPARAAHIVREGLRRRRFPRLTQMERGYAASVRALKLPSRAAISPTHGFESRKQKLEVQFDSPEQLSAALKQITSACESGQIRAIFKTMEE